MRNIIGLTAAILCAVVPFAAGAAAFSFKRVKVGESQPGKRITVQIDPEEQARFIAALPKVDPNPDHGLEDPKAAADKIVAEIVPGRPVENMLSVAVVTQTGTDGDALDNAFYVQGVEKGRALLPLYPGLVVLFFLPDGDKAWKMVRLAAGSQ